MRLRYASAVRLPDVGSLAVLTKSYGQAAHTRLIDGVNDDPVSLAVRVRIYGGHCGGATAAAARGWAGARIAAEPIPSDIISTSLRSFC